MNRRDFIKDASLVAGAFFLGFNELIAAKRGEFLSVAEAFKSLKIDISSTPYFAAMGDPHFHATQDSNTILFKQISDELKSLSPRPAFLAMLGDLISNGTACFADIAKNNKNAEREIEILKECVEYLKPIEAKLVLGNHDTVSPTDFENEVYKKCMPDFKSYYDFNFAGTTFIVLNGGHTMMLDEAQGDWLKEKISKLDKNTPLVILIHQPLGTLATEYSASKDLRDILESYSGDVKIICGHIHSNAQVSLKTPNGKIIPQFTLEAPRKFKAPVYWLFAMKDGKIEGAVFRNSKGKFEAYDFNCKAKDWQKPFESQNVKASFTPLSPEFEEVRVKGWFNASKCIYFYFYLKEIEFAIDLSKIGTYSRLILLASRLNGKKGETKFALSSNGKKWVEVNPIKEKHPYIEFEVPENLRVKKLYVSITASNVEANFGGVAVGE